MYESNPENHLYSGYRERAPEEKVLPAWTDSVLTLYNCSHTHAQQKCSPFYCRSSPYIGSYFTFCSILSFHPYLQTKDHYIQGYRTPRLINWCLDWGISITLRKLIYVQTIRTRHQLENSPLTSRQNICIHLSTTETKEYPRTRKGKCVNKKGCPCPYKKGKRDYMNAG